MKLEQQYSSDKQEPVGRLIANAKWLCGTSVAPRVSNFHVELHTHCYEDLRCGHCKHVILYAQRTCIALVQT